LLPQVAESGWFKRENETVRSTQLSAVVYKQGTRASVYILHASAGRSVESDCRNGEWMATGAAARTGSIARRLRMACKYNALKREHIFEHGKVEQLYHLHASFSLFTLFPTFHVRKSPMSLTNMVLFRVAPNLYSLILLILPCYTVAQAGGLSFFLDISCLEPSTVLPKVSVDLSTCIVPISATSLVINVYPACPDGLSPSLIM